MASNEAKAKRLIEQLEDEGLGNTHRTIAILHQAVAAMLGVKTKTEVPARHTPKAAPKRDMSPEAMRARGETFSPPSAGENPPGAKDARVAKDSRIEDARNTVGSEEDAADQEAKVREAIEEDEALAEEHGVEVGADHPDDEGLEDAEAEEPDEEDEEETPTRRASHRSTKRAKRGR